MEQEAEAEAAYAALKRIGHGTLLGAVDYYGRNYRDPLKRISTQDAVDRFIAEKKSANRRERYLKDLRQELGYLTKEHGSKPVHEVQKEDLVAVIAVDGRGSERQNNIRKDYRTFFNWCVANGYAPANPAELVAQKTVERGEIVTLSLDKVKGLMNAAVGYKGGKLVPYTALATFCAIRPDELARVSWDQVDLGERQVTITASAAKTRDDGLLALEVLRPAAARSYFEKFARLLAWRAGADGGRVLKPVTCAQEMADALLQSEEAGALLPRVLGLINCPVIREIDGQLNVAGRGYDEKTLLLVTGGTKPPTVALDEAVRELMDLFAEFDFQSDGDKARAVASLISPALKVGGFLNERVPADVAEADQSQSGKTYRQKVMAALYNERLSLVTCRQGGVGSVDESLNQQLVAGRPFIQFDNFRGRFESAHLEAFLTAEGAFSCRVPYRGEVTVPAENYFICLTSNGVDTTPDFAKRSNIIRIRKKAPGHQFRKFPEGDLLGRVRQQQVYYLGCVFAVIREWHRLGKPRTEETRHDFRECAYPG